MSRLPIICPRLQSQVMILRSFSRTSQCCVRGFDPRKGIAEDGDYDPHYESYTKRDYNKPVKGNYSESFSGPTQMAKLMDGQKVFEGFPLANKVGIWDYKHMPRTLKQTEFDYPLSEDRFGQVSDQ